MRQLQHSEDAPAPKQKKGVARKSNTVKIDERLVVASDIKLLDIIRNFIIKCIRQTSLSSEYENRIVVAVDEAISNIIEHAYEEKGSGYIDLKISADKEKLTFIITDSGKAFNPNKVEKPDIKKFIKKRAKGGLGIFLMRQIMDKVKYTFKSGQNQICLVKYFAKKKEG